MIVGIGDASFKSDDKAVGGVLLFLTDDKMTRAAPIYWKSKTITRVCYSSKDAETLNVFKMMDDAIFAARQVETLYYGDYRKRMKVRLFTDSEPILESIASSRQVKRKMLRPTIVDIKERLVDRDFFILPPPYIRKYRTQCRITYNNLIISLLTLLYRKYFRALLF